MTYFISHANEDDVDDITGRVGDGSSRLWTVNRKATTGDRILFYSRAPISGIIAIGTVTGSEQEDAATYNRHGVMMKVRVDRLIEPPLSLARLKNRLPAWGWPRSPIAPARVPDEILPGLLDLLGTAVTAADRPPEQAPPVTGGGFGDPETNRRVERAAVEYVRRHYALDGWKVVDRQADACGYDLQVVRRSKELHLEVKGTAGAEPAFILTANEMKCAETDEAFRLCVLTDALGTGPRLQCYTGREMQAAFSFDALSYIARPSRASGRPSRRMMKGEPRWRR